MNFTADIARKAADCANAEAKREAENLARNALDIIYYKIYTAAEQGDYKIHFQISSLYDPKGKTDAYKVFADEIKKDLEKNGYMIVSYEKNTTLKISWYC